MLLIIVCSLADGSKKPLVK